jgi:hypothetical protein
MLRTWFMGEIKTPLGILFDIVRPFYAFNFLAEEA